MSEEELMIDTGKQIDSSQSRRRFIVLITGAILISLVLVGVALALYSSSGAAQLDLSRPGYTSVREQVGKSEQFNGFSASGSVDRAAIDQFRSMYDSQANAATSVDGFGGDVMSDEALSIDNVENQ